MAANWSVGIVGYGAVGRAMQALFPGAAVYDPPKGLGSREAINACRFAFVCLPTPAAADGACDTSLVEEAVGWIASEYIIVRSTVSPGTTARLAAESGKRVIFQPEYGPGETPDHPYRDVGTLPWIILGGPRDWTRPVANLYQRVYNSNLKVQRTDATTAELAKYMENAFLAAKVAFCNEFFDIAELLGVDYHELRELWLMDPRMGRSHTWVHPDERGFGGKCLPKDLDALLSLAAQLGYPAEMLNGLRKSNARVRSGGASDG